MCAKLMTPLFYFYNGSFNRAGRRMRAVFEREVSNGTVTHRIWRGAGQPDISYPRAESDKYILYVELNGYLAPLRMTDFDLTDRCGFELAANKLYGGKENRGKWIDGFRESSGCDAVNAALAEERGEIELYGSDPARQADYIQKVIDEHVSVYLKAKENGGETFPDFFGAAAVNELDRCVELSAVYRAKRQAEDAARRERAEEEEKAFCEERNREAEQAVSAAIQVIRDGGVLKNDTVRFYQSRHNSSSCSVINYLMRLYLVDVPLRTQGWINEKLCSATVRDGKCEHLQFFRSKNAKCSQKFFECMNNLIRAVMAQASEEAANR